MRTRRARVDGDCTGQVVNVSAASPAPSTNNMAAPTMPGRNSPASIRASATTNAVIGLTRASLRSRLSDGAAMSPPRPAYARRMLVLNRFVVQPDTQDSFVPRAHAALTALAERPGYLSGRLTR